MTGTFLHKIRLTNFRSYEDGNLNCEGKSLYLFGDNGAGKTNVLEAISWLSPGKGLRGAKAQDVGRRLAGDVCSRPWTVYAQLQKSTPSQASDDIIDIGTGLEAHSPRRLVKINGVNVSPQGLTDALRLIWLTPSQDSLFLEGASERRRFFDRLVFADQAGHAYEVQTYEQAMRERLRLLTQDGFKDRLWLDGLEARAALSATHIAFARIRSLTLLREEIRLRQDSAFPHADLALSGAVENMAAVESFDAVLDFVTQELEKARPRDAASGRSLFGPHRSDLAVTYGPKTYPAALCSTGEQKALLLNIVLAQATRLAKNRETPAPILLLDEVAAHLDPYRRKALYEEIASLDLQVLLTGVERELFADFTAAIGFQVRDGKIVSV